MTGAINHRLKKEKRPSELVQLKLNIGASVGESIPTEKIEGVTPTYRSGGSDGIKTPLCMKEKAIANKKTDKTQNKKHPGKGITPPFFGYPEADKMDKEANKGRT